MTRPDLIGVFFQVFYENSFIRNFLFWWKNIHEKQGHPLLLELLPGGNYVLLWTSCLKINGVFSQQSKDKNKHTTMDQTLLKISNE